MKVLRIFLISIAVLCAIGAAMLPLFLVGDKEAKKEDSETDHVEEAEVVND